jgi:hypothetical protein
MKNGRLRLGSLRSAALVAHSPRPCIGSIRAWLSAGWDDVARAAQNLYRSAHLYTGRRGIGNIAGGARISIPAPLAFALALHVGGPQMSSILFPNYRLRVKEGLHPLISMRIIAPVGRSDATHAPPPQSGSRTFHIRAQCRRIIRPNNLATFPVDQRGTFKPRIDTPQ